MPRADNVRLGILYMIASVFLFSFQNAIGKWLAQSYPIPMLVFFRSAVALLPSYLLVMHAGGPRLLRTNRLGAQFGRAVIWGGSNVASFFAFHLLPLADAIALTFAAPLFLTALSWPLLKERVSRERWIAVSLGFYRRFGDGAAERRRQHPWHALRANMRRLQCLRHLGGAWTDAD
jgi:drug/metabolite transporter (DMT)-like permease